MQKINRLCFSIIYVLLLINNTKQSHFRQGITIFKANSKAIKKPFVKTIGNTIKMPIIKTIGNTIKKSVGMFCLKKYAIKDLAYGLGEKYFRTRYNVGSRPIKYLTEGWIKKFKYTAHYAAREGKKTSQIRSAMQMGGKGLHPVVKSSTKQMRGIELRSLINLASMSKPQAPFLFAGGLMKLTKSNLISSGGDIDFNFKEEKPKDIEQAKQFNNENMKEQIKKNPNKGLQTQDKLIDDKIQIKKQLINQKFENLHEKNKEPVEKK